jgi:hypothetical protein
VDLERRHIEIRADQAKTASRRLVPVTDNLAAWLEPLERKGRVIKSGEFIKEATALARALGIEWPRNVLRHSFISYRIAIVKCADQVALEAGNSPDIIFKHYRELATEAQAGEWLRSVTCWSPPWIRRATNRASRLAASRSGKNRRSRSPSR